MLDAYFHTIPAKKNVPEVLKALKAQGASLNVLTASPHITLDACLKRLGLWELFDNVWSCDDFNTTKADPQIYVRAAEKMNTPVENVLFLDDNLNADQTAGLRRIRRILQGLCGSNESCHRLLYLRFSGTFGFVNFKKACRLASLFLFEHLSNPID